MDKIYTKPSLNNTPKPSKTSVALILQYAAAYNPIRLPNGYTDTLAN